MRVAMFSTKPYDRRSFELRGQGLGHVIHYFEPRLEQETAALAAGFPAVCLFVNDVCDAGVLATLAAGGIDSASAAKCWPRIHGRTPRSSTSASPTSRSRNVPYVALEELVERSDLISLHCPLTPSTHHL